MAARAVANGRRKKDDERFELGVYSGDFSVSPIHGAVTERDPPRLLRVLQQGADVTLTDPQCHSTFLHLLLHVAHPACERQLLPMVYMLSNAGINVNAEDVQGLTALDYAIRQELVDMMVALIRVGVDPMQKDYKTIIRQQGSVFEFEMVDTFEKYEPGLWAAVAQNNTSLVHMLLNSWCRLNVNKSGISLLQFARGTAKSPELCELIDDYEVTLEFVHATLAGDEKRMLEFLMDSKPCDPYIMDISYQERWSLPLTPRSLRDTAISMGHTHVLHLLPEEPEEAANEEPTQPNSPTTLPQPFSDHISTGSSRSFSSASFMEAPTPRQRPVPAPRKKSKSLRGSKKKSTPNQEHSTGNWNDFYFHPSSYLQLPMQASIGRSSSKKLTGPSLQYAVHDYSDNWKQPKVKSRYNKSKMCVIS